MDSVELTLVIINEIEKVLDLGFNRLYVNVDDLETVYGFLRLLAMQNYKNVIVFEGSFRWICVIGCWSCLRNLSMI